ncbi:MAG TPA: tetratricopeptide repeat protein [Spirochaetia bacterium]|nr:tetratricopeptide repeat protein [Spirochaetia bacterium]
MSAFLNKSPEQGPILSAAAWPWFRRILVLFVSCAAFLASCATQHNAPTAVSSAAVASTTVQPTPSETPEQQKRRAYDEIGGLIAKGEPQKAIEVFESAHLLDPQRPESVLFLANLYLAAGELDGAQKVLTDLNRKDPNNADVLFDLSLVAGARGTPETQEQLLNRMLSVSPNDTRALDSLGRIYLGQQHYARAETAFGGSLKQNPENVEALTGLGTAYMYQGKLNQAEEVLSRAISLAPTSPTAYVSRGRERADNGNLAGAEKDLDAAIRLEPNYTWHYIDRGRLRARSGNSIGAIADFTRAVEIDPTLFLGYAYRGETYDQLGKSGEALSDYEKVLSIRPDYDPVYPLAGAIYFMNSEWERAAQMFRKAYTAQNKEYAYPLLIALCYKFKGDERGARNYLSGVINDVARDSLYYEMCRYYMQPNNDSTIFQRIMDTKDAYLKTKMLFFLGAQYDLNGQTSLAQTVLLSIDSHRFPSLLEARLAAWIVKGKAEASR